MCWYLGRRSPQPSARDGPRMRHPASRPQLRVAGVDEHVWVIAGPGHPCPSEGGVELAVLRRTRRVADIYGAGRVPGLAHLRPAPVRIWHPAPRGAGRPCASTHSTAGGAPACTLSANGSARLATGPATFCVLRRVGPPLRGVHIKPAVAPLCVRIRVALHSHGNTSKVTT